MTVFERKTTGTARSRAVLVAALCIGLVRAPLIAAAAPQSWPRVVTDDLGRKVVMGHRPVRIIALMPSVAEALFAVGAGQRIVGTCDFTNYPAAALRIPKVGGLNPDPERIVGLRPDLVVSADQTLTVDRANLWSAQFHAPVYATTPHNYADVEKDLNELGELAGTPSATKRAVGAMQRTLEFVTKRIAGLKKPTVFILIWDKPLMTAGADSFVGNLVELAGGVNIGKDASSSYSQYSAENLIVQDPDFILTGTDRLQVQHAQAASLATLGLRAVKNGQVWAVPFDWRDRPGPRLALALVAVAKILHPQVFAK